MTTDNESPEPFVIDMEAVEQQLKATSPEQLKELAKRVNDAATSRRGDSDKLAGMPDHEFSAFVQKKFGYYPGV